MKIILTALFSILFFSSCALIKAQNCTENAGYEKGLNDARMGRLMFLGQFATLCSGKEVEVAQNAYKLGYEEGKKNSTPTINLSFNKGKVGFRGAYRCKINYQNQDFESEAVSEPEARNRVLDECSKKIPACRGMEMSVACFKN